MVYIPYIYHISLWPAHLQPSLDPATGGGGGSRGTAGGRRKQQGSLEPEGREREERVTE